MFEMITVAAARMDHARIIGEATAHDARVPARRTWRTRVATRVRRSDGLAPVHVLPATAQPAAARKVA